MTTSGYVLIHGGCHVDLPDEVGRTYVGPVRDRTFPPYLQRRMAANIGATHVPIPGGHEVMYSHPEQVAAELDRIGDAAFTTSPRLDSR